MRRINITKFIEISAILVLILFTTIACYEENEKKMTKTESIFEIESITKVSSINSRIKLAINQFIKKSNDSLVIEMMSEIEKNHNQVDTILNSIAQKKLIVLTDSFSKKNYVFETSQEIGLKDLKKILEEEKDKLKKISHKNKDEELTAFYDRKIEELEQNIATINNFLETQNKSN